MQKRVCVLGFAALVAGLAACSSETAHYTRGAAPDIMRWASPEADFTAVLSEEPRECLPAQTAPEHVMGRLAFRSPFLLGGQAARRGLTCQACHGQGQVNSHFFVIGLSETPGTADVTSFHFSNDLGDEIFNPVPIPSFSDDVEGVDFSAPDGDLDRFVTRLITKEFTGPPPTPEVKAALLSYLRGLNEAHCQSSTLKTAELLGFNLRIISESFETLRRHNLSKESYDFMLAALRIELGRVHARFPNHPALQADLAAISAALKTAKNTQEGFDHAAAKWQTLKPELSSAYDTSLFHPGTIQTWVDTRRKL